MLVRKFVAIWIDFFLVTSQIGLIQLMFLHNFASHEPNVVALGHSRCGTWVWLVGLYRSHQSAWSVHMQHRFDDHHRKHTISFPENLQKWHPWSGIDRLSPRYCTTNMTLRLDYSAIGYTCTIQSGMHTHGSTMTHGKLIFDMTQLRSFWGSENTVSKCRKMILQQKINVFWTIKMAIRERPFGKAKTVG